LSDDDSCYHVISLSHAFVKGYLVVCN